jgi:hypothetical protein
LRYYSKEVKDMALSKSKKMAKERERLFQEAKERARAERQVGKKMNRFGVPVEVLPKDYVEDMGRQTSGWSSYYIERAGSCQSGFVKVITGEETGNFKEPEKIKYRVIAEVEGKVKGFRVTATSITEAYRKVEQYLEGQKIYKFKLLKLQGIKEVQ